MKRLILTAILVALSLIVSEAKCIYNDRPISYFKSDANNKELAILAIHGGMESAEKAKEYCEEIARMFPEVPVYSLNFHMEDMGKRAIYEAVTLSQELKKNYSKLVVIGTSFGGFLGWITSNEVHPEKAVIISGFIGIDKMYRIALNNREKYEEWLEIIPKDVDSRVIENELKKFSIRGISIPFKVLFIHGLKDDIVPFDVLIDDVLSIKGNYYIFINNEGHPASLENSFIKELIRKFVFD
ncbi:MAG: alpha/beta hydrolase family protein [Thermosulfidibacteraceae bacterium]